MRKRPTLLARAAALVTTVGVALAGALVFTAAPAQAKLTQTNFGFQATAYGTRVVGGDLPATSGRTAFSFISCTRLAGRHASNNIAEADLGGAVHVGAVTSSNHTWRGRLGSVHVRSTNAIASVTLKQPDGPGVKIKSLKTYAHSWHGRTGYHTSTRTSGVIVLPLPSGDVQEVPLPGEGETLKIPGLATITGGWKHERTGKHYAHSSVNALRIRLVASNSLVIVGRAWARVNGGLPAGVMDGEAYGSKLTLLGGVVTSGKTAVKPLPCRGTRGVWRHTSTIDVKIPPVSPQIQVTATRSSVYGIQYANGAAKARVRTDIAKVSLGGGQVVIKGIHAQARVNKYRGGSYTKDARGTTPSSITFNGETHSLPSKGSYDLGALGRIETGKRSKGRYGIRVTAVKITLFNGTQADTVLYLGNARARIKPY